MFRCDEHDDFNKDKHPEHQLFNQVLLATGRVPNVKGLGLESASVDFSESEGIYANDFLETTNPHVFALGDCLALANNKELAEKMPGSGPQFTHNSDVQARAVVKNAFGK